MNLMKALTKRGELYYITIHFHDGSTMDLGIHRARNGFAAMRKVVTKRDFCLETYDYIEFEQQ